MTFALPLTMTTLGLQRFTAAQIDYDIDLSIAQVAFTASVFVTSPTLTALPGEFRRVATISGSAVGDNVVHMIVRDDAPLRYEARGFGLFLADGTLFAVYGQADPIVEKAVASTVLLAIDVAFPTSQIASITFGDANFLNPPATTARPGVVQLATLVAAQAGTDSFLVITAAILKAMLDTVRGRTITTAGLITGGGDLTADRTLTVTGATPEETSAGLIGTKAVTPAGLAPALQRIATLFARKISTAGLATGGGDLNADREIKVTPASAAQAAAGTALDVAVTPGALKDAGYIRVEEATYDANGWYRRTSDGFVEMSGVSPLPGSEAQFTLNFPREFPNQCLGIWATIINPVASNDGQSTVQEVALFKDRATLFAQNHKTPTADASGGFRWFAGGR